MASILDRYGIKEVADVTFYEIEDDGTEGAPVLYLDSLKVSTIEQTAEQTSAKGGKGNAELITWDYNKEINVTLTDALFSAKSMAIMFSTSEAAAAMSVAQTTINKTIMVKAEGSTVLRSMIKYLGKGGEMVALPTSVTASVYNAAGTLISTIGTGNANLSGVTTGETYFVTFAQQANAKTITINANSFPGTYKVVGDTFARSNTTGKDEFFQFVINKAKVKPEQTITLEAEGDPSTFNLSLKVMKPEDPAKSMMELISYDLVTAQG